MLRGQKGYGPASRGAASCCPHADLGPGPACGDARPRRRTRGVEVQYYRNRLRDRFDHGWRAKLLAPHPTALTRQRLASAMLYALPGVPVTFQGDECAFLGDKEPRDAQRFPLQWQACDAGMLAHYRQLAALRRALPALRSPVIRTPAAEGTVLSFLRGEPGPGEVLALFNAAPDTRIVQLPAGTWADAATGAATSGTAQVGPLGWRYLERR
jgi:hypothetical protein